MAIILIILISVYLLTYLFVIFNFLKKEEQSKNKEEKAISVLIPFKDESENLKNLIHSLNKLKYSNFEVIFINDNSSDISISIIDNENISFKYAIYHSEKTGKKKAIELGVKKAVNEYIVTTDADCVVNSNWLNEINTGFSSNEDMLILPVIGKNGNMLQNVLSIEQLSLTGTYLALPFFNSGANLAYKKAWFNKINPYKNDELASGDDVFFLHKTIKEKGSIKTVKTFNAAVLTEMPETSKEFILQRIRWYSKSKSFKNKTALIFGFVLVLINVAQVLAYVLPFFDIIFLNACLIYLLLKVIIDFSFLFLVATRFNQKYLLKYFVFTEFLYPFYVIMIPVLSLFIKPIWKGRQI